MTVARCYLLHLEPVELPFLSRLRPTYAPSYYVHRLMLCQCHRIRFADGCVAMSFVKLVGRFSTARKPIVGMTLVNANAFRGTKLECWTMLMSANAMKRYKYNATAYELPSTTLTHPLPIKPLTSALLIVTV